MRRRDDQETTQDRRRDERLPVHVLWVWVVPRESVFGPESIGKHITQLVANWVFPRESVFGPESVEKHITQLIANWVFPSETEYIAGGLLRKSTYPGTATPTQLQMYATDLRGEPRCARSKQPRLDITFVPHIYRADSTAGTQETMHLAFF